MTDPEVSHEAARFAQLFHENYERLAPDFGYKTRESSAVPWERVPPKNQMLMAATVRAVLPAIRQELEGLVRESERERIAQKLATTRGHLEGYADAIALTKTVDRATLVQSLREDAAALETLEDSDD